MQGLQSIEDTFATSRLLVAANLAGHALASAALLVCATARPWIGLALLPGLWHAIDQHRRLIGRHPRAWRRFRWTLDNRIGWVCVNGETGQGRCVVARCWGAAWVQLTIRPSTRRLPYFLVVPVDAVSPDTHRRLRVRSRIRAPQHVAADADSL